MEKTKIVQQDEQAKEQEGETRKKAQAICVMILLLFQNLSSQIKLQIIEWSGLNNKSLISAFLKNTILNKINDILETFEGEYSSLLKNELLKIYSESYISMMDIINSSLGENYDLSVDKGRVQNEIDLFDVQSLIVANKFLYDFGQILNDNFVDVNDSMKRVDQIINAAFKREENGILTQANILFNKGREDAALNQGCESYKYITINDNKVCSVCNSLNNKVFKFKDAKKGENYPLMHFRCRCTITPIANRVDSLK